MAIPDYQTLMLPLLTRLASAREPIAIRTFLDSIADEFKLTAVERAERIPSGQENLLANRLAWARTYPGKAGLLVSPRRGFVSMTDEGRALLTEHPQRIDLALLRRYPHFAAWYNRSQDSVTSQETLPAMSRQIAASPKQDSLKTPRERIDGAT